MFAITDKGKFEGVGAHDDLVMGLALANAATQTMAEQFVLIDDFGVFDTNTDILGPVGITGLNL